MPSKPDSGATDFFTLLASALNPSDYDIDEDDAQRFENGLPDVDVNSENEACVHLRMTIYEKNN